MTNKIKIVISAVLLFGSISLLAADKISRADTTLVSRLKGKILLQVEQHGEAWYLNPADEKRYYLGRPGDALALMRDLGRGISDQDLAQIPLAQANLDGQDDDQDGLSNALEDSLGTAKNKADTDGDGYSDKTEILNNYNPLAAGKLTINTELARNLAGLIVLQVERHGEAWYINPDDQKRYYMSRPTEAFNLMRRLGLGISDKNLAMIQERLIDPDYQTENIVKNYTTVRDDEPSIRQYSDPNINYSLDYPDSWLIKKFEDFPNTTYITDAQKDFIIEKRAVITITYFSSSDSFNDVSIFRVASKEGITTLTDKKTTVNDLAAYENSYDYQRAFEKTTTVELDSRHFLRITLLTANQNNDYYLSVYDQLLSSLTVY